MSQVIYKYPVQPEEFTLMLPKGAKILTAQTQFDTPQMWALVDPEAQPEPRRFVALPTGLIFHDPTPIEYINTFRLLGGSLIFHLFEITEPS